MKQYKQIKPADKKKDKKEHKCQKNYYSIISKPTIERHFLS